MIMIDIGDDLASSEVRNRAKEGSIIVNTANRTGGWYKKLAYKQKKKGGHNNGTLGSDQHRIPSVA